MSQRPSLRSLSSSSSSGSFFRQLVCLATAVAVFAGAGGCTKSRVEMVAKYNPGEPARLDRTPDVGVYKIKFAVASPEGEKMHTLAGSQRFLGKGQPVGFVRGAGGEVIAVAGEERFTARLPEFARFCVWYTKNEEESEFGKGLGDALASVGAATLLAGAVAGVVVLKLATADDDDCRDGVDCDGCRDCDD